MPIFRLRSWAEQTLYDFHDYEVEAPTIEEAAARLREAQEEADEEGTAIVTGITRVDYSGCCANVRALDPEEIVDGDSGIAEIDVDGKKLRDIDDCEEE